MIRFKTATIAASCLAAAFIGCSTNNPVTNDLQKHSTTVAAMSDYPNAIEKHAACINVDNRIFVFTLHQDGNVRLKIQTSAGLPPSTYPLGYSLLGRPSGYTLSRNLAAGRNRGGQMYVFGTAGNKIFYKKQTNPGSTTFSSWIALPVTCKSGGNIAVANLLDGTFAVFYLNASSYLYLYNLIPGGGTSIGKIGNQTIVNNFTVKQNPDARLEVFTPTSNAVYHIWQNGTSPSEWEPNFVMLGITTPSPIDLEADIACVINQSNLLEIFINTTDGKLWNCWQDFSAPGSWYNGWNNLLSGYNLVYKKIAVGKRKNGGLDLVFCSKSGTAFNLTCYAYQPPGSCEWIGPSVFTGLGSAFILTSKIATDNLTMMTLPSSDLGFFCSSNYITNFTADINMDYAYEIGSNPNGWSRPFLLGWDQ